MTEDDLERDRIEEAASTHMVFQMPPKAKPEPDHSTPLPTGDPHSLAGQIVSEAEAATGLGFASVIEFRRWDTERGRRIGELEHALKAAQDERDRFRTTGIKMMCLLNEIKPVLVAIRDGADPTTFDWPRFIHAIGVVSGFEADWGGVIHKWMDGFVTEHKMSIAEALEKMKAWQLTDNELDELMR